MCKCDAVWENKILDLTCHLHEKLSTVSCALYYIGIFIEHDCKFDEFGRTFEGSLDHSQSGVPCVNWTSEYLTHHEFYFPDETLEDLGRKCRNPDYQLSPWCITEDGYAEICEVDHCGEYNRPKQKRFYAFSFENY